ncbi:bifunctional diguanylate cyclase/phosphodiesterase [Halanaerobium praevalens]|uniref:Diguanylate cyclase/phosphodiesterase with extracellular sensor n=1 Tax=Halanaerobium praevalens (strain ATCC 33744 / DSM 2228 / GSL) TaxID=572479 RepID=E3DMR7_HALPG|nr:EAL domain-containing protein [Halanaerobium praevalens]ADO76391.1 diguanylate cyclase/phosphodiesterase with extracellular sensor [Halanaerobium praevalens DSM 2228]
MKENKVKWYNSLLIKVNWAIVIIIIIFIAILTFAINQYISNKLNGYLKEYNLEIVKSLQKDVNKILDNGENALKITADLLAESPKTESEILSLFEKVKNNYQEFEYIYLANQKGEIIIKPQIQLPAAFDPRQRNWYQKAVKENKLIWTDAYLDANQRYLMITVALPLLDQRGARVGVLAADIRLSELSSQIVDKKIGQTGYPFIINKKGQIIVHPNDKLIEERYNVSQAFNPQVVFENKNGFLEYNFKGQKKIAAYLTLARLDSVIFSQIAAKEVFMIKDEIRNMIFKMGLVVLIILTISVLCINKKYLLNPLSELVNQISKVASRNYNVQIKERKDDEIGLVYKEFNNMTEEINAAYQQLAAYNQEITALNGELEHQAKHDLLTGIANRRSFLEELQFELAKSKKTTIILLDLDNFKEINDTLGHVYGDQILKKFSSLLAELENKLVSVARFGGDEFLILLKETDSPQKIKKYIKKIKKLAVNHLEINKQELYLGFSLGIASYPKDAKNSYDLITKADTAMYEAKKLYNQDYLFYNQKMINKMKNKKLIKEKLQKALKNDGFELKYQPQVKIKTGEIEYLEALIRFKDYKISPGQFIPVAEEYRLINQIGRWVTEKAIKELAVLNNKKGRNIKISINFSAQQLNDQGYIEFLTAKLKENRVAPEFLEIEITESLLINNEAKAIKYLTELSDLGIKLALDDFGTGYSSLNYVNYISFDKVKLDKKLIEEFLAYDNLETISSLIALFNSIKLPVVAEGVETREQYQKLKSINCDYIQGYLFSKPVLAAKLDKLLSQTFN